MHKEIRHAVAGFDVVRLIVRVPAQRSSAIVNTDLRKDRKESLSDCIDACHKTCDWWKDRGADDTQQPVRTSRKLKHPISGIEQTLGVRKALFVVSIEQSLCGLALNYES